MNLVEVKTAELIGPALDWAVAVVEGLAPFIDPQRVRGQRFHTTREAEGCWNDEAWQPSINWSQGGPLIETHQIDIVWGGTDEHGSWWRADHQDVGVCPMAGTPLIAACRAIVAAKLGDVVSVPAELVRQP